MFAVIDVLLMYGAFRWQGWGHPFRFAIMFTMLLMHDVYWGQLLHCCCSWCCCCWCNFRNHHDCHAIQAHRATARRMRGCMRFPFMVHPTAAAAGLMATTNGILQIKASIVGCKMSLVAKLHNCDFNKLRWNVLEEANKNREVDVTLI